MRFALMEAKLALANIVRKFTLIPSSKTKEPLDAWGGPFAATKGLVQDFGTERIMDAPISEAGFVGAAIGAALTGLSIKRAFAGIYAIFNLLLFNSKLLFLFVVSLFAKFLFKKNPKPIAQQVKS